MRDQLWFQILWQEHAALQGVSEHDFARAGMERVPDKSIKKMAGDAPLDPNVKLVKPELFWRWYMVGGILTLSRNVKLA